MPNQYTKFQEASEHPTTRAFTWREWNGKKQKRGRRYTKKDVRAADGEKQSFVHTHATTNTDHDVGFHSLPSSLSASPSTSLLQYSPSSGLRMDPFCSYAVIPDHAEMAVLDHCMTLLSDPFHINLPMILRFVHTCSVGKAEQHSLEAPQSTCRPSHQYASAANHARSFSVRCHAR